MALRSDRETHYVAAFLEFWERPRDWDPEGLESAVSSFAPVREWLNTLTTGLHVSSLRRAMREVAAKHPRPPPLDPVRSAYFRQLAKEKQERQAEQMSLGACVHCGNSGVVYVAAWNDRTGRTRVISPSRPAWVPCALHEAAVACSCVAGDDLAKDSGWSQTTRRKFVALKLSHAAFLSLRDQVSQLPPTQEFEQEELVDVF